MEESSDEDISESEEERRFPTCHHSKRREPTLACGIRLATAHPFSKAFR